jgi:hypothetical protein
MAHYCYADCYTEEDGSKAPGKLVDGELVSGAGQIPPGCRSVHFDRSMTPERFVLQLHPLHVRPLDGWVAKTVEEIEADYPGVLGGA